MTTSRSAPFDWLQPRRNPAAAKGEKARREAMYRAELEERATLLQRLGRSRAEVRARLAANLDWDFSASAGAGASPIGPAAVDAIVDRVFDQAAGSRPAQTAAGRSAPRPKGEKR
jgi:hypothetical protein